MTEFLKNHPDAYFDGDYTGAYILGGWLYVEAAKTDQ